MAPNLKKKPLQKLYAAWNSPSLMASPSPPLRSKELASLPSRHNKLTAPYCLTSGTMHEFKNETYQEVMQLRDSYHAK